MNLMMSKLSTYYFDVDCPLANLMMLKLPTGCVNVDYPLANLMMTPSLFVYDSHWLIWWWCPMVDLLMMPTGWFDDDDHSLICWWCPVANLMMMPTGWFCWCCRNFQSNNHLQFHYHFPPLLAERRDNHLHLISKLPPFRCRRVSLLYSCS